MQQYLYTEFQLAFQKIQITTKHSKSVKLLTIHLQILKIIITIITIIITKKYNYFFENTIYNISCFCNKSLFWRIRKWFPLERNSGPSPSLQGPGHLEIHLPFPASSTGKYTQDLVSFSKQEMCSFQISPCRLFRLCMLLHKTINQ